jgi:putative Holliday junction resolvase
VNTLQGRLLALDPGQRRTGVAISDPLGMFARPLTVIEDGMSAVAVEAVRRLCDELDIAGVVVGYPRPWPEPAADSGGEEQQAQPHYTRVRAFAAALEQALDVPVELWDEHLSSQTAEDMLKQRGYSASDLEKRLDSVAAAIILEDYIAARCGTALLPA